MASPSESKIHIIWCLLKTATHTTQQEHMTHNVDKAQGQKQTAGVTQMKYEKMGTENHCYDYILCIWKAEGKQGQT